MPKSKLASHNESKLVESMMINEYMLVASLIQIGQWEIVQMGRKKRLGVFRRWDFEKKMQTSQMPSQNEFIQ